MQCRLAYRLLSPALLNRWLSFLLVGVACLPTRVRPEYSRHTVVMRSSRRLDSQDDVNKTLHYEESGWQIKNPASLRDFRLVSSVVYSPFGVINYLWLETSD